MAEEYTKLEQIRQTLDDAYEDPDIGTPADFAQPSGFAPTESHRGNAFEDGPADFQSFASSHRRYLYSQRAKSSIFGLGIALIVLTILRAILGWLTAYHLVGRLFILLPWSIEAFFNLLFAGFGARAFGSKPLNSIVAGVLTALYLVVINYGINIFMFILASRYLRDLFEPDGTGINVDWLWLFQICLVYFVFTVVSFLVQLVIVAVQFGYLKISYNQSWFQPTPRDSLWVYLGAALRIIFFATVLVSLAMIIASSVSFVNATTGNGGHCNGIEAACYEGCDPLDPYECIFPFPSSYFLKQDSTTATGYRVNFGPETLPKTRDGGRVDPQYWNEMDGFSTIGPMLFYFNKLSSKGFGPVNDLTFDNDHETTIVIDTVSNEIVPHWVELDMIEPESSPCAIIQPGIPLRFATRYVVGIRRLVTTDGDLVSLSPAFNELRGATPPENQATKERWDHFQTNIFPILAERGWNKSELQLAWDFVTTSRESSLGRVEHIRDDAIRRFNEGEVSFDITRVDSDDCNDPNVHIGRTVWGQVHVPFYLQSNGRGGILNRNGGTRETIPANGQIASKFLVRIPCSLLQGRVATKVVQYGHGLFGSRTELNSGVHAKYANQFGWIMFSSDWYGMSKFDVLTMTKLLLSEPSNFVKVPETTMQGWINKAITLKVIKSAKFRDLDEMATTGFKMMPDFSDENNTISYYGISQGGVVGGGYVGMSTDIQRATLGVPGTPFALLLSRSHDFTPYKLLLGLEFYTWRHSRMMMVLMQQLWDPAESGGWLSSVVLSPGPGAPVKQVLIQAALGDAQVTTIGAHIMARAYGAEALEPETRKIWGVKPRQGPYRGSAIVEWQYEDVPAEPIDNTPPEADHDTHECPRREPEAQEQLRVFLETGMITQHCNGKCIKPKSCK